MTKAESTTNAKPATVPALSAHAAPKGKSPAKRGIPKNGAPRGGKGAKERPTAGKAAKKPTAAPREGTKMAGVLELLGQKQGATLAEIMKATNWQAHTVRGFISGTLIKKQGLKVESFRSDDKERTYRVTA